MFQRKGVKLVKLELLGGTGKCINLEFIASNKGKVSNF